MEGKRGRGVQGQESDESYECRIVKMIQDKRAMDRRSSDRR